MATGRAVPSWSGMPWETTDGRLIVSVHIADEQSHPVPPGWTLDLDYHDADTSSDVFIYRREA